MQTNHSDMPSLNLKSSTLPLSHCVPLNKLIFYGNTVESHKFEVLGIRDFILKYRKFIYREVDIRI